MLLHLELLSICKTETEEEEKKNTVDRTLSREMRGIVDYCVQATKLKSTFLFFFLVDQGIRLGFPFPQDLLRYFS